MKNKKLVIILATVLAVLIAVFAGAYFLTKEKPQDGLKDIKVTVVFADESKKVYEIETDGEYLIDALLQEKIVAEKAEDGLYAVVADERADFTLDGRWWQLRQDGKMLNEGFNTQVIEDGDHFEIKNTPSTEAF